MNGYRSSFVKVANITPLLKLIFLKIVNIVIIKEIGLFYSLILNIIISGGLAS